MGKYIKRFIVSFYTKKAFKHNQCKNMLLEREDNQDLIYAIGVAIVNEEKYIKILKKLCE